MTGRGPVICCEEKIDDGGARQLAELETSETRESFARNKRAKWKRSEWADEIEANASLMAAAPDADLLLRALLAGAAAFDSTTKELRFAGLRYDCRNCDWSQLLDVVGREKLLSTIEQLGS